ncbi:hypothetical protein M8C17_00845 [Micromonospora sp. RHAY321]|uniref:hypothetical protein n=1 Tax=Micromonospora sp. RHAY321 TaxID=2944807 RepID=UPI00207CFEAD|nr:hypothetical protein [Micromonospora sp. RHAY321]MCO1593713.1 hypothetical protein [Micromonospora sp. RHAY321]
MPERPVAADDSAIEHPPPPEVAREPRVSAPDARDADGGDDHKNHDPYQPL